MARDTEPVLLADAGGGRARRARGQRAGRGDLRAAARLTRTRRRPCGRRRSEPVPARNAQYQRPAANSPQPIAARPPARSQADNSTPVALTAPADTRCGLPAMPPACTTGAAENAAGKVQLTTPATLESTLCQHNCVPSASRNQLPDALSPRPRSAPVDCPASCDTVPTTPAPVSGASTSAPSGSVTRPL